MKSCAMMIPCVQGTSGVYQLNSASCPSTFADNPSAGQKQLLATTKGSGGVKALSFAVPGTVRYPSSLDLHLPLSEAILEFFLLVFIIGDTN